MFFALLPQAAVATEQTAPAIAPAKSEPPPALQPATPPALQPATPLAAAIAAELARAQRLLPADAPTSLADGELEAARAFYAAKGFAPLWTATAGLKPRANSALAELARAGDWGLEAAAFPIASIDDGDRSLSALARSELLLTGAVLKYARHARGGRIANPETLLSGYIDREPKLVPPATVLEAVATNDAVDAYLRGLHPKHPQFDLLRRAYLKAREGEAAQPLVTIPSGPLLIPGKSHPQVALLRQRLSVPAAKGVDPALFDGSLVDAVKAVQAGAKLRPDGMVGDRTRAVLNRQPAQAPTAKIIANMEKWRWMPEDLGATRIEVNVPEQQVRFVRDGVLIHTERVIVGKMDTATPLFSDQMETIVFQPKWGVPQSIKINELLPQLQAGNGLKPGLKMSLNGREVDPWDIDWYKADITRYMVYQPSGDGNALGQVKFLFPNKHAVYLHDTPNKRLFNADTRLFSHGCIRVRNPIKLAELLLATDKGWSSNAVRDLVDDGPEDNVIKLDKKIPVHIMYFTAAADEQLNVKTAPDLYGHEKRVTLALQGQFERIVKLDPKPVVNPIEVARQGRPAIGNAVAAGSDRRVRVNGQVVGQYPPPASLGYYARPPEPVFQFVPPSPVKGSTGGGRYRGNTSNDMIMRSLGGF
jgi:murein L,D-transpeptidase YcbB/YkuD